ncbi:hypothetical protein GCM10022233_37150 [Streptomyces shaanxiensis]|uniref:Uncharacterized protein n=1 Tax=Streptomyces shaanxiensis TaxID=653357 RepID=A0ABP7V6V8_9ACTN
MFVVLPPDGAALLLTAGDVVFLPYGAMHGIRSYPDQMLALLPPEADPEGRDVVASDPWAGHGGGGPFCCAVRTGSTVDRCTPSCGHCPR